MINSVLYHLDALLIGLFGVCALGCAVLMLVARQPMRVAMALIATMAFLGAIYGLLGVHVIAAFQVLIYVGAVMVFMVFVIMLLEVREEAAPRYSRLLLPALAGFVLMLGTLGISVWHALEHPIAAAAPGARPVRYGITQFSTSFLNEYWLHFELTTVLLLAAVVAAMAVIRVSRRTGGPRNHG